MRALIDTCIIVDALQSREPFKDDAQTLFLQVANKQFEGFITAKASTDVYYLTHRYTHSDKDTRRVLGSLYLLFDILDTTGMDCIVTRNIKDYSKSLVPVYLPSELLAFLTSKEKNES